MTFADEQIHGNMEKILHQHNVESAARALKSYCTSVISLYAYVFRFIILYPYGIVINCIAIVIMCVNTNVLSVFICV